MQTFLPYRDFDRSARCLDRQRLGKQRVECLQILRTLAGESSGWSRHPAVKMWRGHSGALARYGAAVCAEWIRRGYRDTCLEKMVSYGPDDNPSWLGNRRFHNSHRSNLLRKDPTHYGQFGWKVGPDLEYVWPKGRE